MFSRRKVMGLVTAGVTFLAPGTSFALTENQAERLVQAVVSEVENIIDSKSDDKEKIRRFEALFSEYGDTKIMARYALGADARGLSKPKMKEFEEAFKGYIATKYGKRFREFSGGKVRVLGSKEIKAGYEVTTETKMQGYAPFEVSYFVSDKSGRPSFYNMHITGINLLLTERAEIGAILDRSGRDIDKLIEYLRSKS